MLERSSGPNILVQCFELGVLPDLRACLKIPSHGSLSALPVRRRRLLILFRVRARGDPPLGFCGREDSV